MTPSNLSPGPPRFAMTVALIALAELLWLAVFLVMLVVVPHFERTFADFQVRVPAVTEAALLASRWYTRYWYVALPAAAVAAPALALGSYAVRHQVLSPWLSRAWWALALGLPLLIVAAVALAMYLPMASLTEALER